MVPILDDATRGVNKFLSISTNKPAGPAWAEYIPVPITGYNSLKRLVLNETWSPIIYHQNYRCKSNFKFADFLGVDIDDGMPIAEAADLIKSWECAAIIGTTKSHQKEKNGTVCDRYRIVFPMFSRCESIDEFEFNTALYVKVFGGDTNAKDGARLFFQCYEIYLEQHKDRMDWQPLPVDFYENKKLAQEIHKVRTVTLAANKDLPRWVAQRIETGVPAGGDDGRQGRKSMCYAIGRSLAEIGYSLDEIVSLVCSGPLSEIGVDNVRKHVWNGFKKGKSSADDGGAG